MRIQKIVIIILLILVSILGYLVYSKGGDTPKVPSTFEYVEGVPCHSMGSFYMGECEFDSKGNPTNL